MNFVARITNLENGNIGRIGGNIPEILLDKSDELVDYDFYLMFQDIENKEQYFSVFVHKNFDDRIDRNVYPNIAVKVFTHLDSLESNIETYTSKELNINFITEFNEVDDDVFNFITYSKTPNLIQEESHYFVNLTKNGFHFFIQIDEDFYTDMTIKGNYIFAYGALYLFKHEETGEIVAGFWQY